MRKDAKLNTSACALLFDSKHPEQEYNLPFLRTGSERDLSVYFSVSLAWQISFVSGRNCGNTFFQNAANHV